MAGCAARATTSDASARASPSAAITAPSPVISPPATLPMTVSMTAGISPKFNRLSRKACTAISSAAFRLAQLSPPSRAASCAWRRQGKRWGSGARKSSRPARTRSRNSTPAAMRCGQASALSDRHAHIRRGQLRQHRAILVLDQRMHDALRVHHHLDLVLRACRTARWPRSAPGPCSSAWPSRPRSCGPCSSADARRPAPVSRTPLPRRDQLQERARPRQSAAAGARPAGAVPARNPGGRHWKMALCSLSIGISCAPETLHRRDQQRAGHDRRLLVGEQQPLAGAAAASVEAQTRRPADRRHHVVRLSSAAASCAIASAPATTRVRATRLAQLPLELLRRLGADSSAAHSGWKPRTCCEQQLDVAARRQRATRKRSRMQRQHLQRVDAHRAGRAEYQQPRSLAHNTHSRARSARAPSPELPP